MESFVFALKVAHVHHRADATRDAARCDLFYHRIAAAYPSSTFTTFTPTASIA